MVKQNIYDRNSVSFAAVKSPYYSRNFQTILRTPHLPLPVRPEPRLLVAVSEVVYEDERGHVAGPLDQVLDAEVGDAGLE